MKSDELLALFLRRGVLWPTAEIYGGAQGLYDYGPLGAALKRRIEDAWTSWFVGLSPDYYRIEPAELLPEAVVRASGHLENFTDPEIVCDACHTPFRAETVLEAVRPEGVDGLSVAQIAEIAHANHVKCPRCGSEALSVPAPFNMMFGVDFGVTGKERAYLRPETAQNSFLAFPRMWEVGRHALPLGVAVVGKAYRNEIAPRQVLFRLRAFTQAELQIFFDPEHFDRPIDPFRDVRLPVLRVERRERGEETPEFIRAEDLVASGGLPAFYVHHMVQFHRFFREVLAYPEESIRFFEKSEKERAFYNKIQFDAEVRLESFGGYKELGAVHYRGDYDLTRHAEGSGKDLAVTVGEGRSVLPHVLELTFGVDRNLWGLGDLHLRTEDARTVWHLPPFLAPVSVGVFPLIAKAHGAYAQRLADDLARAGLTVQYDAASSIGRRYARIDEAGTPYGVTVDAGTLDEGPEHDTVTVRERDSRSQARVPVGELVGRLAGALRLPRPPRI